MESFEFININKLIRDASVACGDLELNHSLTKGWYVSTIKDCLDELSYQTYFQTLTKDFFNYDQDQMQITIPVGVYNIQELYVWNGSSSDLCSPLTSQPVYWKRQFNNSGGGVNYTATRKMSSSNQSPDGFNPNGFDYTSAQENGSALFFNIQNGILMLSQSCRGYKNVRIVYSGTGGDINEVPCVPRYFNKVVKDWVRKSYHSAQAALNSGDRFLVSSQMSLGAQATTDLYDARTGSWWAAKDRVVQMNDKEAADLREYFAKGNW